MESAVKYAIEAIAEENDKQLDKLIKQDPRLINWRDESGLTLLHRAAQSGSYNCSQVLLHRGADPYSSLSNQAEWIPIHLAARDSQFAICRAYIDYKIKLSSPDAFGRNILHIAAMHGSLEFILQLLELDKQLSGINIDDPNLSIDSNGWGPIHYASWYGHDNVVELLVKHGINSILTDRDGYSPLHLAIESENLVSIKILLNDARPKLTPSGFSELLSECIRVSRPKNNNLVNFLKKWENLDSSMSDPFPLHAAVNNADLTALKKSLNEGICKINEKNAKGETSLHLAARLGLDHIVEFLLDNGADHSVTIRGTQIAPLELAVKNHHFKTARLLGLETTDSHSNLEEYCY